MNPNMAPIPIPPEAAASRPECRALRIGPPPGISDAECGTVESLVGRSPEGYPMFAGYWRPDAEQLAALQAGGFIELIQYFPRMVMHSMTVWDVPAAPTEGCSWVDCQLVGEHEHEPRQAWVNPGDPGVGKYGVVFDDQGTVRISEAVLAQLLTEAGWERAR